MLRASYTGIVVCIKAVILDSHTLIGFKIRVVDRVR
jgi:hypothetical protein